MEERINEEIRQYKLYKIQITESKVQEYKKVYDLIRENIIIKIAKNSTSFIIRVGITILVILLFVGAVGSFFPKQFLYFLGNNSEIQIYHENFSLDSSLPYIGALFLGLSILMMELSKLIKVNNAKRNTVYEMSKLLDDIILYMENTSVEEKQKYEAFMDTMSEHEIRRQREEKQSSTV